MEQIFGVFGMIPIVILNSKKKPRATQCKSLCMESRARSDRAGQALWWMKLPCLFSYLALLTYFISVFCCSACFHGDNNKIHHNPFIIRAFMRDSLTTSFQGKSTVSCGHLLSAIALHVVDSQNIAISPI